MFLSGVACVQAQPMSIYFYGTTGTWHAEHLFSIKTVLKFFILSFFDSFKDVLMQKMPNNIDKIPQKLYGLLSSLVDRQLPVRGGVCSSPGKSIIFFNLGSLYHQMNLRAVQNQRGIQKNKISQNLNVLLNLLLGAREHYHNSLQIQSVLCMPAWHKKYL